MALNDLAAIHADGTPYSIGRLWEPLASLGSAALTDANQVPAYWNGEFYSPQFTGRFVEPDTPTATTTTPATTTPATTTPAAEPYQGPAQGGGGEFNAEAPANTGNAGGLQGLGNILAGADGTGAAIGAGLGFGVGGPIGAILGGLAGAYGPSILSGGGLGGGGKTGEVTSSISGDGTGASGNGGFISAAVQPVERTDLAAPGPAASAPSAGPASAPSGGLASVDTGPVGIAFEQEPQGTSSGPMDQASIRDNADTSTTEPGPATGGLANVSTGIDPSQMSDVTSSSGSVGDGLPAAGATLDVPDTYDSEPDSQDQPSQDQPSQDQPSQDQGDGDPGDGGSMEGGDAEGANMEVNAESGNAEIGAEPGAGGGGFARGGQVTRNRLHKAMPGGMAGLRHINAAPHFAQGGEVGDFDGPYEGVGKVEARGRDGKRDFLKGAQMKTNALMAGHHANRLREHPDYMGHEERLAQYGIEQDPRTRLYRKAGEAEFLRRQARDTTAARPGNRGANGMDGYAAGGTVTADRLAGPDPAGPDQGYAALKEGEFVVREEAAQPNLDLLRQINATGAPPPMMPQPFAAPIPSTDPTATESPPEVAIYGENGESEMEPDEIGGVDPDEMMQMGGDIATPSNQAPYGAPTPPPGMWAPPGAPKPGDAMLRSKLGSIVAGGPMG